MIDLRSDTVTQPCDEMRKKMATAIVGDDMFGEDPSVNELQEFARKITGKEEVLFVPSASMSNQLAVKALTAPGDAIAVLKHAHVYRYESGAAPLLSGVTMLQVGDKRGIISVEEIGNTIPPDDQHYPPLTLLCMENTHNGQIVPIDNIKKLHEYCCEKDIKMHLDGARIFNASVATGIDVKDYAKYFDTVTICLSKGLGAPIGALICSNKQYAKKIHRFRKVMGGAMRQSGIIAAAGLYALQNNVQHLSMDHKNAQHLASGLKDLNYLEILGPVETNMVFVSYAQSKISGEALQEHMMSKGVNIVVDEAKKMIRLVTHRDITMQHIDHVLEQLHCFAS
ncbi:low-specificity L-threonine aldolase [Candidatus Uabimicrobium amorphum]|uniref:Threonine aldolase n=1 Tax=Uabimicrobium amorphum TaxID=2596890 RepID=A0A5S9IJK3_UABAM|nr:low-specificity L-threonine aldolase [Candidatus Uabimicrobium amorphum]BBM82230.1 threonine aldolase [Candidatus Uabimicrobium amorphum]